MQHQVSGPPVPSSAEQAAMRRALELAQTPGVPLGPNPRVGCVLLDRDGTRMAEGYHRGAGHPHAEVEALADAGGRAAGCTAVVTLEPCRHVGRTGPCTDALIAAGVRRVVFAQTDPDPLAGGGAERLRDAGVVVVGGLCEDEAEQVNRAWTFAVEHGRPLVTWKFAASLDGRSAAADGTSRWVSNAAARRDTHLLRSRCDVVLAGTGTVLLDDPQLTVRGADDRPVPTARQPLRAVMGLRELPSDARVLDDTAPTVRLRTRNPEEALAALYAEGRRHVLLEGGPHLAAAFLQADVVDEVVGYLAPKLLGGGAHAVEGLPVTTIGEAWQLAVRDVTVLGEGADLNVRVTLTPPSSRAGRQR